MSNPTIRLDEIRSRRFDLIDRSTNVYEARVPDEPMKVTVKRLPYRPSRFERLDDVLAIPA